MITLLDMANTCSDDIFYVHFSDKTYEPEPYIKHECIIYSKEFIKSERLLVDKQKDFIEKYGNCEVINLYTAGLGAITVVIKRIE